MAFPKPDAKTKAFLESIVPKRKSVSVRPMFGNLGVFEKGNMFMGVFGKDVFVRLPEKDRLALLRERGTAIFEPLKGRPMTEYVKLPKSWRKEKKKVDKWVARSLRWASTLPKKAGKKKAGRKSKKKGARKKRSPFARKKRSPFARKKRSPFARKKRSPFARKKRSPFARKKRSPFARKSRRRKR